MNKLVMFYEDRNRFVERHKENIGLPSTIVKRLSGFLLDFKSVNDVYTSIKDGLAANNIDALLIESSDLPGFNRQLSSKDNILVWNITDGVELYTGSYLPSYAKLLGLKSYGSSTFAQALAQNKYKFLKNCKNLNTKFNIPESRLVYSGHQKDIEKIKSKSGKYFVKLNDFDNNIGILSKSKCKNFDEAKKIAFELYQNYQQQVLIQEYIDGRDIRVSFIDLNASERKPIYKRLAELDVCLGSYYVDKKHNGKIIDYIHEGIASKISIGLEQVKDEEIVRKIITYTKAIVADLKIEDYFAIDFRIDSKKNIYLMEVNTAPFINSQRFKKYITDFYEKNLSEALVLSLKRYFF